MGDEWDTTSWSWDDAIYWDQKSQIEDLDPEAVWVHSLAALSSRRPRDFVVTEGWGELAWDMAWGG